MAFVNNALKDGILMQKIYVYQLVIYALPGPSKELVNHAIMVILLDKVPVLKIMILALYLIVTCFARLGLEMSAHNAQIELFLIKMDSVFQLVLYVIHLIKQQEYA